MVKHQQDHARCWVEIDLAALERNLHKIRAALPSHIRYVAVVKADAYGHGLAQTATRLMQCGADMFAVANVSEAATLREMGSGWPILVLSSVLPQEDDDLFAVNLIPTLSTLAEVERFNLKAKDRRKVLEVHLKIDTGMGRLGVWHEDVQPILNALQSANHLKLDGVFTHFSCAPTDPDFTELQRKRFLDTLKIIENQFDLSECLIHADNSASLKSFNRSSPFNAVRVGLLQFGAAPYPDSLFAEVKTEPVLSFHGRVSLVKTIPAGNPISYGRLTTIARSTTLAVLSAGYADGIPMPFTNRAEVLIQGNRCPVLGRVTMDQLIVDVTDLEKSPESGDIATFIGTQDEGQISISEFSRWGKSIPWECFCSISKRVTRVYKTFRE
ncbi:MAG: alanine racemase [Verrucomicrobia bacterium]|nr:alanine racemase [Verrucomicrobiota bacterium]